MAEQIRQSYRPIKRGKPTYKGAQGNTGRGSYSGVGTKPATKKRLNSVDKKVKKISSKIMRYKSENPGKANFNRY